MKNEFKDVLREEASKIDINLTEEMLIKFEIYKELLVEWNKKMNLTAITEDYEVIMKHFVDCLEIVKYIHEGQNIVDVGTGAGFPGIVISIYFNSRIKMTLLDAQNKRLLFLEEVIKQLKLQNIEIVQGRAEELAHKDEYRQQYDIVVSRAVANLSTLLEFDSAYIKVGGKCLFLKGENVNIEIKEAKKAFDILHCELDNQYTYTYNIKGESYDRRVLSIKKIANTPPNYPRNNGQIKKNPLNQN
ncbi:MAG: 16S rRNA (guanine(527)-N(7))-methyltransferase RsmG [Clostridia bacterium]|nr:16S rRNA (guanine(527)-N(7))-methyltransferase RsmG [Clostridia bacterium]